MQTMLAEDVTPVWKRLCVLADIPRQGSRVVSSPVGRLAVFRTGDDAVYALHDRCPHKGGPLSQGLVHGNTVTCPMHGWKVDLATGEAVAPDKGCARTIMVKVEDGLVWLAIG
jgi:nitrite reductase (NADH) small subunit